MSRSVIPEAVPRAPATTARMERSDRHRPAPGPGLTGRVLLVDNDSAAASFAADVLARDGHQVELRQNLGDAALLAQMDVVIVDPRGTEDETRPHQLVERLLEHLRPTGDQSRPEVVVMSAIHDVDAAVAALHRGASDYLVKPVQEGRLRLAVARALERRRLLNENVRLKRDLALFAAAQRVLETLDPTQLATFGVDALCSFAEAHAGVLWGTDIATAASRGLSPEEVTSVRALEVPLGFVERMPSSKVGLPRFLEVLLLDLGDARFAALFSRHGFARHHEEGALFLARQIGTAFKNCQRFASAEMQARRDPLTGLWNAQAFQDAVQQLARTSERESFSLLFLDIDHFKGVNDKHGHVIGSRMLVELGRVLEAALREGDVVSRYGGDEFTALLPAVDVEAALRIAERVRASVEKHEFASGIRLTVCIGVASWPRHASDPTALLESADRAMYVGKGATRNSVHVALPVRSELP